ncbi:MAG TPA: hypothetical protein VGL99_10935 [Chloroflexota bacterium]
MLRWLVSAALVVLCGCMAAPASMPPELTVQRWAQALAAQDGNAVAKLTCRASQADNQTQRLLSMALGTPVPPFGGGAGAFGGGGAGNAAYDVTDLAFETTFADDRTAEVRVTGFLKMVSGLASQVVRMNSVVGLTREDSTWRVCNLQ